jgi:transcriptional regulator with XRE-family HTH domain
MKIDVAVLREKSGLNQTEFWERIGITQSGGSRYESGDRQMPQPVLTLLRAIYIDKIDLSQIRRGDVELISFLRKSQPGLYKALRRQATAYVKEQKK